MSFIDRLLWWAGCVFVVAAPLGIAIEDAFSADGLTLKGFFVVGVLDVTMVGLMLRLRSSGRPFDFAQGECGVKKDGAAAE